MAVGVRGYALLFEGRDGPPTVIHWSVVRALRTKCCDFPHTHTHTVVDFRGENLSEEFTQCNGPPTWRMVIVSLSERENFPRICLVHHLFPKTA